MISAHYQRVLLKFSGEALSNAEAPLDPAVLTYLVDEITTIQTLGVQIGIVLGGGNIFRGLSGSNQGISRVRGDHMGMLATVINALALQEVLESRGMKARTLSAIRMIEVAEPMLVRRANQYLANGEIVLFAAGTGNPFFSTDSGAALRASEIGAQLLIKATKVDGVYDKDPVRYPDAIFYARLDYQTVIEKRLKVMDLTALTICQDNHIPIVVYNMKQPGNLRRVILGEPVGTMISGGNHD